MMDDFIETDLEKVTCLKNILLSFCTGGHKNDREYKELRSELMTNATLRDLLPAWLRTHRSLDEFWPFIKHKFGSYAERRHFLAQEFDPVLSYLETGHANPASESVSQRLKSLESEHIHGLWLKALERCKSDPEGAITAVRALLESVCKCILDEYKIEYSDNDLPKLYSKVAEVLNIAPSQHTEKVFKQILGGCHSVVEGLGALRNRLGDAHGQGKRPIKPAPRHAELAVNLAGAMATFLVATYKEKTQK